MQNKLPLLARFILFTICFSLTYISNTPAQTGCSDVPVIETIKNGDFSGGNTGFTVGDAGQYTILPLGQWSNPGFYQVSNNDYNGGGKSTFNSPSFDAVFDHTNPGVHGNMLMIDAAKQNDISWQTSVTVQANQVYYFSAWVTELFKASSNVNNAILQFEIVRANGAVEQLGLGFQTAYNNWQQTFAKWTSAGVETITLRIRDTQSNISSGNDFALDDISFINGCNKISSTKPDLGNTQTLCTEGSVTLNSTIPGNSQQWFFTPKGSTVGTALPDNGQSITATQAGRYQVCVTDTKYPNCPISSFVDVLGSINLDLGPDVLLCDPPVATLNTKLVGSKLKFEWKGPAAGTVITGAKESKYTAVTKGDYSVSVTSSVPGCSQVSDNIKISSNLAIPNKGTFCSGNASFSFTTQGGKYAWYKTANGLTDRQQLGTGTSIQYPVSNFGLGTAPGDTLITLYVEDTTLTPGLAGAPMTSSTGKSYGEADGIRALNFDVIKEFVLDSVHIGVVFYSMGMGMQGSITILKSDGSVFKKVLLTIPNPGINSRSDLVIPVYIGARLPVGSNYKIILNKDNSAGYNPITALKSDYDANGFPYVNPGVVSINSPSRDNRDYNFFYDWKISNPLGCGRVPVTLTKDCPPCSKPVTFNILPTTGRTICSDPSKNIVLQVSDTANAKNPSLTGSLPNYYYYEWFKADATGKPSGSLLGKTNSLTVTPAMGSGKYLIRLSHKDSTKAACYLDSIVSLQFDAPFKNNTVTPFDTICLGSPAKIKKGSTPTGGTGVPKYQWEYFTNSGNYTSVPGALGTGIDLDPSSILTNAGTTFFRRKVSGGACPPSISDSAAVLVIATPNPGEINMDQGICTNGIPTLTNKTSADAGASFTWLSSTGATGPWTIVPGSGSTADLANPPAATGTIYYRRAAGVGKCSDTTKPVTITTVPGMNPGSIKGDASICFNKLPGKIMSNQPAGGGTGTASGNPVSLAYQWQSSTTGLAGSFVNISGENNLDFQPPTLTTTTFYQRQSTNGGTKCDTNYSNKVAIIVLPKLTPGEIQNGGTSICTNQSVRITSVSIASGGKGAPYVYRWEVSTDNGTNWVRATNSKDTIGLNTGLLSITTWFRRVVEGNLCDTALSNIYKVTVNPIRKPAISINDPGILCSFSAIKITAAATDTGAAPSYSWKLSSEPTATSSANPEISRVWPVGTPTLTLIVNGGPGCFLPDTTSRQLTIVPGISPGTTDTVVSICAGDPEKEIVSTSKAAGGTGPLTEPAYQWQQSANGTDAWTDISGATTANYKPSSTSGTTTFLRRKATNGPSNCDSDYTKVVKYSRSSPILGGKIGPNPLNPICGNISPGKFESIQDPTNGNPNDLSRFTSIAWYRFTKGSAPILVSASDERIVYTPKDNLPASKDTVTYFYYRKAAETCGTAYSDTLALKVFPVVTPFANYIPLGPICKLDKQPVTVQPTNAGKSPAFTWYYNGVKDDLQTTGTYINPADWNPTTSVLRVVVTPSSDICTTGAVDTTINLVIQNTVTPTVRIDPAYVICGDSKGSPIGLQFKATSLSGGGNAPQYQFFKISNGVSILLQDFSLRDTLIGTYPAPGDKDTIRFVNGDSIKVIMKSNSSCADRPLSDAVSRIITIIPTPDAIVAQPKPTCLPNTITLTAENGIPGTQYQWFRNKQIIAGANNASFVQKDSGTYSYQVVMLNSANGISCRDTSKAVTAFIEYLYVSAGNVQEISLGEIATLQGERNPSYAVTWTPSDETGDSTFSIPNDSLHPQVSPPKPTIYTITMVSAKTGCTISDQVLVRVFLPIWIPNAFSPNSDGKNDTWEIDGIDSYSENTVRVFNRWGNVVYEKAGYKNSEGWNGTTTNGEALPVAVYYFVVDPKNPKGGAAQTGFITIVK